jgi:vacuolar-type H+-ATPase subunit E/Vma4
MTYKIQIDDIVRDASEEEAAVIDAQKAAAEAQAEAQAAKAIARQALLERLGITEEEAQLLLGGI